MKGRDTVDRKDCISAIPREAKPANLPSVADPVLKGRGDPLLDTRRKAIFGVISSEARNLKNVTLKRKDFSPEVEMTDEMDPTFCECVFTSFCWNVPRPAPVLQ
jgi:hypothetical protein